MINPDDIKAGMVLGHADAQILRDAVLRLNNLEMELLALRKASSCHHNWNVLRLVEAGGRYQYCTLCGAKKVAE